MKDTILSLDFLSVKPQICFKNKLSFYSITGLVFSLLIGLTVFIFGIFFLRESTDRVTYFLTSSEKFIGNELADLSSSGFSIVFDIRNGLFEKFPEFERYFSLQVIGSPFFGGYVNITKCSIDDRGFQPPDSQFDLNGNENWCLPKDFKIEVARYGGGQMLKFIVNPCVNETSRPDLVFSDMKTTAQKDNCYPIEKIEEKIKEKDTYIFLKFIDHQINHTSTDNIFPFFENFMFFKISSDIFLRYQLKYQVIHYNLDMSFIFEQVTQINSYLYNGYDTQVDLVNKEKIGFPKYSQVDIILDPNKKTFNRSYVKLQTLAANIGDAAKFFLLFGEMISYIYLRKIYLINLCNSLINYSTKSEAQSKLNIEKTSNFLMYKSSRVNDKVKNLSIFNNTSNPVICFSNESTTSHISKPINNNGELKQVQNYVVDQNKSNTKINQNNNLFEIENSVKNQELSQSFIRLVFWPTKEFNKSVEIAYNMMSYEKLLQNIVELSELKVYIINSMNLKYSGNCKLNYIDN